MTLLEVIVLIAVVVVLCSLATPHAYISVVKSRESKDLSNARLIHLALFNFASDHDGEFPSSTDQDNRKPNEKARPLTTSNDAFANLIPRYIASEKTFWIEGSAWCNPTKPDENITPGNMLAAGENGFAYVEGLSTTSNGNLPLVADGFKEGQPGVYTSDVKAKGGVWRGKVAVVVRVDGSGALEQLNPTDFKVYGHTTSNTRDDIFAPAPGWLEPKNKPLNPASK